MSLAEMKYQAVWESETKLKIAIEMEMAETIQDACIAETRKAVAGKVVEELSKSTEFQKGIRELAVKKILKLLEEY